VTTRFPPIGDLLVTVRDYLGSVTASMSGGDQYQARIAIHLLDICIREIEGADAVPDGHLSALLGCPTADTGPALRLLLASARDEKTDKALLSALIEDSVSALELVRPDHLAKQHRRSS
jgi:hypothetical protein